MPTSFQASSTSGRSSTGSMLCLRTREKSHQAFADGAEALRDAQHAGQAFAGCARRR